MQIIFLEPVYKEYIWGGTKLNEKLNKNAPYKTTAESWEISTNKNGKSKITNGEYKGLDLEELYQKENLREEIFGKKCVGMKKFPLLIKFIDAQKDLSVQVHPDDEYAMKYENDTGKTEMWYILDCKPNAKLIYGLKEEIEKEKIANIIRNGEIKDNIKYIDIQKGDCIYVPAGTVHAILANTLICEIQQNCDLTYRVYDWDRVDKNGNSRELHIEKAIDVIKINNEAAKVKSTDEEYQKLIDSKYFKVDKIQVDGEYAESSNLQTFFAINVIEGEGIIYSNNKEYKINKGNSFIIPAKLGTYKITGKLTLLKSYI